MFEERHEVSRHVDINTPQNPPSAAPPANFIYLVEIRTSLILKVVLFMIPRRQRTDYFSFVFPLVCIHPWSGV